VIYDVHEDVPKQILNKKWIGSLYLRKIVAFFVDILEKISAKTINGIVCATESISQRFPKHKTITLRNLPILKIIDDILPASSAKNKPIIIYAGGLTRIRGIREIIQSMEYINEKAELWLLGNWESDKFKEECEAVKGWVKTKYLGFKPLEEVYSLMKSAEIGISILYPVKNYLTSLPVKTYEYMACSLPVIMSDFPYWKEIFGDFALFANPNNPEDIAQQILFLLEHKDRATELGKKGREFAETRYNWETESKKLLKLYQTILTGE
jgi:glycosyltransferase involved in cell wall biosynthesis